MEGRYEVGRRGWVEGLTLNFRLFLASFVLQHELLEMLPLCQALLLVILEIQGDIRIHRNVQCTHLRPLASPANDEAVTRRKRVENAPEVDYPFWTTM